MGCNTIFPMMFADRIDLIMARIQYPLDLTLLQLVVFCFLSLFRVSLHSVTTLSVCLPSLVFCIPFRFFLSSCLQLIRILVCLGILRIVQVVQACFLFLLLAFMFFSYWWHYPWLCVSIYMFLFVGVMLKKTCG